MRLRQLGLDSYGNFATETLDLDAEPGRINLVLAPNGAGKSVLRQAISELLFGIHPQTPMGFEYGYGPMRLRAEAVFADGEAIGFVRRKGTANTLTSHGGGPPHPTLPDRLPRATDRERLKRLFVLDSAQLRAGGKALLQTDGDLADALLSSAGEVGSARQLAADFAAQRDREAPRRKAASATFYRAADEWTAANARLADTIVRPPTVAAHERERAEAIQARDAAIAQDNAARDSLARLSRIRATRFHLEQLDAASDWLATHPEAPILPRGAGPALETAKQAVETATREAAAAQDALATLQAALENAALDTEILAQAPAIERLTGARTQSEHSRDDIPKREAELSSAESAIARLLRELSSDATPAGAAAELRPAAEIAAARELVAAASEITAARAAAAAAKDRALEAVAAAEDELAALPQATASEAVRAAHDEAMADGDPANLARKAQDAVAQTATQATGALARIPGWTGDAAALAALPVPATATLGRLDHVRLESQAAAAAAAARRAEAERGLDVTRARLADLTAARPLPDAATLAAARAHRDRGLALVFARLSGNPDPAEAEWSPGTPLPLAFARAVTAADEIADNRLHEIERLATAAELQAAIGRAQAGLTDAATRAGAAAAAANDAQAAWAAAITPLGLEGAATLAELRAFLDAREAALAAVAVMRAAEAALADLTRRQAAASAHLASVLQTPPDTLTRLVAFAKLRLTQADQAAAQRQTIARTLATARRALTKAAPELEAADARLAAWSKQWDAVLTRLRLPLDAAPAVAAAVLDRIVQLPALVNAAETARGRLTEMRAQLREFTATCAAAARCLGEPGDDPLDLARRLAARLERARKDSGARDALARQIDQARTRHRDAMDAQAEAARRLSDSVQATGADTLEEARHRIALAAEREAHEAARATARLELRKDGEGLDEESLRDEAEATPPDLFADAMRNAEAAASVARAAVQEAVARIERAEGALRTLAAGQDASRAGADRQAAAARLARVLEDSLVQHLAATMLEHALEEVEAMSVHNERLARLGATFAALTGGAYDRLSPAEEDADSKEHGRLIAHETGGADKHIGRLSEGTRDQLYLALRLVAIEDHIRTAPRLPFVADDILQTFDDTRARAALEALVGLSQHVQVIVLTHHPHLLGLADGLPVHRVRLPATLP